ncbi:MarR family winged helix-turn-helix transcriptional regulator [Caulobacter hibisci]|uniref:MarR family transcriptional regulator n=1 Tax=Caulobacter hibisci TaxID=2035993 RepID=A0ABS0SZP0_9CAUL|nr:MarR family transcriptional regulator [Caulobacter hibisci]MBI1684052.1 MarR family transcriptional regulator [Caulobacter hibisci]
MSIDLPLSPLGDHLEYWLRSVSNYASHALGQRLQAEGVTTAEWSVLRELYDVAFLSPTRLAKRLGLSVSAITKLADRLTAKNLVAREEDEDHGRRQRLVLTAHGRALVPALAAHAHANEVSLFEHISLEDQSRLKRLLIDILERRAAGGRADNAP